MTGRFKGTFDSLSTILVCVAALFVVWAQIETRWLKSRQGQQVQEVRGLSVAVSTLRHMKGSSDVALIEFTDYECPFCGQHAREAEPILDDFVVNSKRLRRAIVNFPLERIHTRARSAALAAECAGRQERFREMHRRLFADEQKLGNEDLLNAAKDINLNLNTFSRCIAGEADSQIANDVAEGRRLGVTSTPTFFVGRVMSDGSIALTKRIKGILPASEIRDLITSVNSKRGDLGNRLSSMWRSAW